MPTVTRLVTPSAPLALLVLMVRAVLSAAVPLHSVKGGNGQLNPPLLDPPMVEDPVRDVAPPELELVTPPLPLPLPAAELPPPVELPALEPPPVEEDEEELDDVLSVPVLVLHPPPSKPPTANKPPTAAVQEKMRMALTFR